MAGRSLQVWVTRTEPGASDTARRLSALGHRPLVAPVLMVRPLAAAGITLAALADGGDGGALAFTSANGVRAFAALNPARDLAVFAVGEATAAAAMTAGFTRIDSAAGDVAALAMRIGQRLSGSAAQVLHPCAVEPAGDLVGALIRAGLRARSLPVYETQAIAALPPPILAALQGQTLDVLLIHSPKAARTVADLLAAADLAVDLAAADLVTDSAAADLTAGLAGVRLIGLSAACIAALDQTPFASAAHAADPTEDSLLRELGTLA